MLTEIRGRRRTIIGWCGEDCGGGDDSDGWERIETTMMMVIRILRGLDDGGDDENSNDREHRDDGGGQYFMVMGDVGGDCDDGNDAGGTVRGWEVQR